MDKELYTMLQEYANGKEYPFHMPGHKRRFGNLCNPYELDITEVEGFDNLHHPEGILDELQKELANAYGASHAYLCVNGSSGGILGAIGAACHRGEEILMERSCHKSVYHGVFLRQLKPIYLYKKELPFGTFTSANPEEIEQMLKEHPKVKLVVITSPTYDGITSDIKSIGEIVHRAGAVLLVDQAHGAHFGLLKGAPENAIREGADMVVVSLHKTLPAFTQTALLLTQGDRVSPQRLEEFRNMFETSSPSYLFMAGAQRGVRYLLQNPEEQIAYQKKLDEFYEKAKDLTSLHIFCQDDLQGAYGFDRTKILIGTDKCHDGYGGEELLCQLHEEYQIQLEMAAGQYAMGISTICDTKEGFNRLLEALKEIDCQQAEGARKEAKELVYYRPQKQILTSWELEDYPTKKVDIDHCSGYISGEYAHTKTSTSRSISQESSAKIF